MSKKTHSPLWTLLIIVTLTVAYLIVSIPFKVMEIIPGFTDIRPVSMLQPVYGIFFGVPGCIAFAVGNLITDIVSNSLRWSSIAGFAANFLGPFCFYLYWCRLSRAPFDLKNMRHIIKHIVVILIVAVIETVLITPAVALVYPDVDHMLFFYDGDDQLHGVPDPAGYPADHHFAGRIRIETKALSQEKSGSGDASIIY